MRLFTGIELPDDAVNVFERLLAHFRPAAHLKWSPAYNLHITARFIGEWKDTRLGELQSALGSVAPRSPFTIILRGLGWFPNERKPRVFWAGVEAAPDLERLTHDIDAALEPLGLAREDRDFSPHLTLARIKQPVPLNKLHEMVGKLETTDFASFTANRFYLYRSQPGAAGSIYTKLTEFPFRDAAAAVESSAARKSSFAH